MMPLGTSQELQWLVLLCCCLLYGLQATGVSTSIWNSCKNLCKGERRDCTTVHGPDEDTTGERDPPQWVQGFTSSFEKLSVWCEESRKILHSLASNRPHMDLLPEIKTQCDLLKADAEFIRAKVDAGVGGPSPQARAEDRAATTGIMKELGDLMKGLQSINSDTKELKEIKQLSQETRRQVFGTHGLEAVIHNITTCIKGQQNFASALPKIVKTEHDEIKQDIHRLEDKLQMLAEAHGDIQELMRKVVGMLEKQGSILEGIVKKGAPEQSPPASPQAQPPAASPKVEKNLKTEGLKVPDYVPSVPPHSTPATVSLSDALGPPRQQPGQHGPDVFATMAMCMEMMRTMMHQHQAIMVHDLDFN